MLTHVEFRSNAFPAYDDESQTVNPGRFGRRLAEFLVTGLRERGERAHAPIAEDWGWRIPIEHDAFDLWIGVGNYEEYPDGFLCFIEPHTEQVGRLWKRVSARERVERLQRQLADVLAAHPEVRDLRWSSHEEFSGGGP